ncbi:glycosyltransferase family 9 protein [Kaistia nematophila]|uniref:Glycosyltransferase family 9 protein n=1 Tax=Kaistia nematophila TaxID=2994654 RepID=A0A9X3IJ37_9HYPH|nr:glycosyltransferase family 9 protein [Kaistia nematophila]MCX5568144.1 glycosyltransferase family 9 protein [Kaistia nematophila]
MTSNSAAALKPIAVLSDRAGLGDALMVCPLIWAVAERYPGHPIWWISSCPDKLTRTVYELVADIAPTFVHFPRARYWPVPVISALLKLPRFHRVFDVRSRVGDVLLARAFLKSKGFQSSIPIGKLHRPALIVDRSWSTIEADAGRKLDWTLSARDGFHLSPKAEALAAELFPADRRHVGIAVTTKGGKGWPVPRNIAFARLLLAEGLTPVFFSGPSEREEIAAIRAAVPEAMFTPARYDGEPDSVYRLELTAASARRMTVGVAPDTGLGHLMGISLVPMVSLFGPGEPERWAPQAVRNIIVQAPEIDGKRRMDTIEPETVLKAVHDMLGG